MNENAGGEDKQQPPFGAPDAFKAIWQGTHPLAAFGAWIDNLLQDPPTPFKMYNEAVKKNGGDPLDQYPKSEAEAAAPVEDEDEEEAEFDEEDEDEYEDDDFDEDEEDEYEDDDFDEDEDDGIEEMDDDAEMSDLERGAQARGDAQDKEVEDAEGAEGGAQAAVARGVDPSKVAGPRLRAVRAPQSTLARPSAQDHGRRADAPMLELEGGEVKTLGTPPG